MSRFRRLIPRIAIAITAPLVMVVTLELVCLLAGWGHPTRFLLRSHHEGVPVWIDNQLFGYRFFDPAVSRAPTPIQVPVEKADREFRVVVLGESAAMGEPEPPMARRACWNRCSPSSTPTNEYASSTPQ
jgi:hypothetical protein